MVILVSFAPATELWMLLPCGCKVQLLLLVILDAVLASLNESPSVSVASNELAITSTVDRLYLRYTLSCSPLHPSPSLASWLSHSPCLLYLVYPSPSPSPSPPGCLLCGTFNHGCVSWALYTSTSRTWLYKVWRCSDTDEFEFVGRRTSHCLSCELLCQTLRLDPHKLRYLSALDSR